MECGTCHKLIWVLLFHFSLSWSIELCALRLTTVNMQEPHALIVCKCDDKLFNRKSFQTLDFIWETFMQPTWAKYLGPRREEYFPVTLNNSGLLDWNWLQLVSEIKSTNMSETLANQQFSECLIWLLRPCWSWTMNSIIWCMKEILKEILQKKWI